MTDLVVLTSDRNLEYAIRGILARTRSLGIRPVTVDIHTHPAHDPGCFAGAPEFLSFAVSQAAHALVVLDHQGSGQEQWMDRAAMEADVETRLSKQGWDGRNAAIVIAPELENWVWSDSPHVDMVLGWSGRKPSLREWLLSRGHACATLSKPLHPKGALLDAIRLVGKSRTSKLYGDLAAVVSLERCVDPAFAKLKQVLRSWFGVTHRVARATR
jgi:hypothetical protein